MIVATKAALEFTLSLDAGNITRAMAQVRQEVANGVRGMARAAQDEGRRLAEALGRVASFREMKQAVAEARGEWSKAQAEVARLATALHGVTSPTRAMVNEFNRARQAAAQEKSAFDAKSVALQRLRTEMRAAGIDTAKLAEEQRRLKEALAQAAEKFRTQQRLNSAKEILGVGPKVTSDREILRLQAAYERLRVSGTMTTQELARAHLAMTTSIVGLQNATDGWASRLALVREQLVKLAVLGAGIGLASKEAINFESAMADVRKVVDFPTPTAFKEMTADIKNMSREIPLSLEGLAQIATAGGQMGIAAKDIRGFTEVVAKMATAFTIPAAEAGVEVGRLMNVFALTVPQTKLLADAINHLGNNTNAVEKDIVTVMNRTGGMARVFGLANTETAALSTTFLSMGLGPERASTAVNALLRELMNAPKQTAKFKAALQGIGLSGEAMAQKIHDGPQKAIMDLLETIKGLDKQTQMETLVGLFGDLYSDEIVQVVNNLDKYKEILGLVGKETNYAGSMQREFNERMKTTKAQLQLATNAVSEAAVELGNGFLPAITLAAKGLAALMHGIASVVSAFPLLAAGSVTAITAFAGFGAIRLVWSALRASVIGLIAPLRALPIATLAASLSLGSLSTTMASLNASMSAGLITGLRNLKFALLSLVTAGRSLLLTPIGIALTLAGAAYYAFSKATESSVQPLLESASALGQSREAATEKIKTLEKLQATLKTAKPDTQEYIDAERQLAEIVPEATVALDDQGRVLAKVGGAAGDNAGKLQKYIDTLKGENNQTLVLQMEAQARASIEAQKEIDSYSASLKRWYSIGEDQNFFQRMIADLGKWTGAYDKTIAEGDELRRKKGEAKTGFEATLKGALKAGVSLSKLREEMDKAHVDPKAAEQIVNLYQTLATAAEAAALKVGSVNAQMGRFATGMTGPANAAKKAFTDAIGVASQQLGKFKDELSKHKQELQKAVEEESKSWKAMGDVATARTKATTERLEDEYSKRRNRLEAQALTGTTEDQISRGLVTLALQETEAKLAEARRYQTAALVLVQKEFATRLEQAERLGIETARVDEEMLLAKKQVMEKTESAYRSSIDKLISEEKRHLDAAHQIAEQRASFGLSVEDRLAKLAEKGKSQPEVYKSRQTQIKKEESRAEEALRNGDYEKARAHAEKMITLAESTAEAVKKGDKVVVSEHNAVARASEQIKRAAEIADQAFKAEGDSHIQSASKLRGEYEQLVNQLAKVRAELDLVGTKLAKDHTVLLEVNTDKVAEAAAEMDTLLLKKDQIVAIIDDLRAQANFMEGLPAQVAMGALAPVSAGFAEASRVFATFKTQFENFDPEIKARFEPAPAQAAIDGVATRFRTLAAEIETPKTINVAANTTAAEANLHGLQTQLNNLHDKTVTVTTRHVEAHAGGGVVGDSAYRFARGGLLPGYGGGDRRWILAEDGEMIIRKERTRKHQALLLALNSAPESVISRMLATTGPQRFAKGGMVSRQVALSIPRFANGGLVSNLRIPSMPATSGNTGGSSAKAADVVRFDLSFNSRPTASLTGPRQQVRQLTDALRELQRGLA